ncbi:MAG: protein kinase [Fimbriiglobus sp.]|nr:protein kinase [Fimbriiglobus sp.]
MPTLPRLAAGVEFGGYRIVRELGGGGMGQVYEAFDPELVRAIAIKVLRTDQSTDPGARARFLKEARALAAVAHPHVVVIHQVSECDGHPFLVMELVAGETLDAKLRAGPLPLLQALNTGREVAGGLAAAHRAGVVHRDVKPDNIVLAPNGSAKLIDFGLAYTSRFGKNEQASAGTPRYMSPEQVRGGAVTERSDLFSLGVVLYRMVTGRTPFDGASINDWRDHLLSDAPPPPPEEFNPDIPPPLSSLILRLLAKQPDERPESAWAVEWELAELLRAVVTPSGFRMVPPPPTVSTLPVSRRRRRWLWVAVAAVAVAVTATLTPKTFLAPDSVASIRPTAVSNHSPTPATPIRLFDGRTLTGWKALGGGMDQWSVEGGVLVAAPNGQPDQYLMSEAEFGDHIFEFEFRWPIHTGHSSVAVRAVAVNNLPCGFELNLNRSEQEATDAEDLRGLAHPLYAAGGIYQLQGPSQPVQNVPVGRWNRVKWTTTADRITVEWNGRRVFDEPLKKFAGREMDVPALTRKSGAIVLRTHGGCVMEYRDLIVTPLGR